MSCPKGRGRNAATLLPPKEDEAHKNTRRVLVCDYTLKKSTTFLSYGSTAEKPLYIVVYARSLKLGSFFDLEKYSDVAILRIEQLKPVPNRYFRNFLHMKEAADISARY